MASRRCRGRNPDIPQLADQAGVNRNTNEDCLVVPGPGGFVPAQAIDPAINTGAPVQVAGVVLVADVTVLQWIVSGYEDRPLHRHLRILRDDGRFVVAYREAA